MSNKPNETIYKIPYIEYEYMRYKASRMKNRIKAALILTNLLWICLTAIMVVKGYEKRGNRHS